MREIARKQKERTGRDDNVNISLKRKKNIEGWVTSGKLISLKRTHNMEIGDICSWRSR